MACNLTVSGRRILENLKPVFPACWSSHTEGACEKVKWRRDDRKICFPCAFEANPFKYAPSNLRLDAIGVGGSIEALSSSWNVFLSFSYHSMSLTVYSHSPGMSPKVFSEKKILPDLRPGKKSPFC